MAIPDKAITRGEQYLAAMAGQSGTLPEEPITRKEFYLAKAAGQNVETPEPITREEMYLDVIAEGGSGGGGGGDAVLVNKTVTENGIYAASDDGAEGYSTVTVDVAGSGGDTYHFYTYTPASDTTINSVLNAANIPLLAQDEVLIWNIKGANKQSSGTVGFKFGVVVVQDGNAVSKSGGNKRMVSVAAPDSSKPDTNWGNNGFLTIENGHYVCSQTSTFGYVGGGNTFEFVQFAYDIGWNVEA